MTTSPTSGRASPSAPTPPPAPVTPASRRPRRTSRCRLHRRRGGHFSARVPSNALHLLRRANAEVQHPPDPHARASGGASCDVREVARLRGVLDACGVGATPTELRARIGPKAWESSPARQDLIAALRGSGARPHTRLDHRATKEANAEAGRDAEASDESNVVATARLFHGLELREATAVEAEESKGIVPAEASSEGDFAVGRGGACVGADSDRDTRGPWSRRTTSGRSKGRPWGRRW